MLFIILFLDRLGTFPFFVEVVERSQIKGHLKLKGYDMYITLQM